MQAVVYQGERPSFNGDVDLWLHIGENLRTGETEFRTQFGEITSLERDMLVVASAVLAADVAAKRGMRVDINRDMRMTIPVVNIHAFTAQGTLLQRILHKLSDDRWDITFVRAPGEQESILPWPARSGKTLLFSGGLDSLAAAIMLLDENGAGNVQLVSHRTGNTLTISTQNSLYEYLQQHYGADIPRISVKTGGKDTDEDKYPTDTLEVSQRTRSFLFLTIAAVAARRRGMSEIVMIAENGQMAIHVPLSSARIGAFSTHTAHPDFVSKVATFFSAIMDYEIVIQNPFQYQTKAEVVAELAVNHQLALPRSMSCWKGHRVGGHCGFCIPCLIRRIALEHHGLNVDTWRRDIFAENVGALPYTDEGKRNISELAQFVQDFNIMSDAEIDLEHCEVNNSFFDRDQAVAMYRRFSDEAIAVFENYPSLSHLLE